MAPSSPETEFDPVYASLYQRLGGFGIDLVLLLAVAVALIPVMDVDLDVVQETGAYPGEFLLAMVAVTGVYYAGLTALRGQTVGKLVLGIKVVMTGTGAIPHLPAAILRWTVPTAAALLPYGVFAWLLVYGWIIPDGRRQGLHDKAARTIVLDIAKTEANRGRLD